MTTIRRGDQTTTDEWLAKRPGASGKPEPFPTIGRIVWYRSAMTANTGVVEGQEVPAIIAAVYSNGECDLHIFRANGLTATSARRVPFNDDIEKRHTGAWRWPVLPPKN